MNAGYFKVSKELIESPRWEDIYSILTTKFTEVCRKEIGFGLIEIHGESKDFDVLPEGATGEYEAMLSNGSVVFNRVA